MSTTLKVTLVVVGLLGVVVAGLLVLSADEDALRAQTGGTRSSFRPPAGGGLRGSGFGQVLVNFFSLQWLFGKGAGTAPSTSPGLSAPTSVGSGGTAPSGTKSIFGGSSGSGGSGSSIFGFGGKSSSGGSGTSSGGTESRRFLGF